MADCRLTGFPSASGEGEWFEGPEKPSLEAGEGHVWLADLVYSPEKAASISKILSADEIERTFRYQSSTIRNRFLIRRGLLRLLLGRYLKLSPDRVELAVGPFGKPRLADHLSNPQIEFNLSSSSSKVLFALHLCQPVGIDIEQVNPDFDYQSVASSYFSSDEQRWLLSLEAIHRRAAFYRCWVRKEAYLKGLGTGFSQVGQLPGLAPTGKEQLKGSLPSSEPLSVGDWFVYDLKLPEGFMGALAVWGESQKFYNWKFSIE